MRSSSDGAARGLLWMLVAGIAVACGGGSAGTSGNTTSASPPARAQGSQAPVANAGRVAAIAAIITKTSNPDDGFVAFRDSSDAAPGGPERLVQMSCDGSRCHFEALCDKGPLTCSVIGPKLEAMGLAKDPQNELYFTDRNGSAADFAQLTDAIYLSVLGASQNYHLTWRTNRQTAEVPVPGA